MSAAQQLFRVPFYEDTLAVVILGHYPFPFVDTRIILDSLELSESACPARSAQLIPLRKFPAWLASIDRHGDGGLAADARGRIAVTVSLDGHPVDAHLLFPDAIGGSPSASGMALSSSRARRLSKAGRGSSRKVSPSTVRHSEAWP